MKNEYSAPTTGPFPLQGDVRQLKPNLGSVVVPAATLMIFITQGPLENMSWHDLQSWRGIVAVVVVVGALLGIGWFVNELLFKKIYFSRQGIGIVKAGSTPVWYSFDEMKTGTIRKKRNRLMASNSNRGTTIKLEFYTGTVTIRTGLYGKAEVAELTAILSGRTGEIAKSLDDEELPLQSTGSKPRSRAGRMPRGGPFSAAGIPDANEPDIEPKKRW